MSAALDRFLDAVEWVDLDEPDQLHPDDVFATHEGVLRIPGAGPFRCYQLNTGERVIDANDVAAWLAGEIGGAE